MLLDALQAQTLPADAFEVVAVADGAGPDTHAVLAGAPRPVRVVSHETSRGPAAGRNSGWRAGTAPLVAFTDDDCVPHPEWLQAVLACAEAHPGAVIQGPTRPNPAERERLGPRAHTVRIERLGPVYETCNIAYPRALLERLGGFSERYGPTQAGEDVDLAWRAIGAGAATVFADDAVVHHAVETIGPRTRLWLANRSGGGTRALRDHPQYRAVLYRGLFWNVWHYLLLRSLVALAAPPWLRRLVLARHLAQLRTRGEGLALVPELLAADAVECAAIIRGALRDRVWVL
jgi:GT2 family glycosyltransferase